MKPKPVHFGKNKKPPIKFELKSTKNKEILIHSSIIAIIILIIGLAVSFTFDNFNIALNSFVIAVFVVIIPSFLYNYIQFLKLKSCEKYLPLFLGDLKEAKKSGVSFPEAIKACRGDYGKLDKYINKLKKDISWGVSIDQALKHMQRNLKKSPVISRSLSILLETYRTGGNIEDILETLINSLLKIMDSEKYKQSVMQQHVVMMYGIFMMYIGLIIIIGNFLIPMINEMGGNENEMVGISLMEAKSPCLDCGNPICYGLCGYYNVLGGMLGFGEADSVEVYYKSLFLTMILIQGFFTGIVAGQISSRDWLDGVKHGLIMFMIGLVVVIITNLMGIF
ncbi:MAG: type II secretion system F family protein [Candidatus Aenigmarchaeota archaeon]|nr:type II secretion system F family protein [Candidatus Aenigmarchaeota archaeon]